MPVFAPEHFEGPVRAGRACAFDSQAYRPHGNWLGCAFGRGEQDMFAHCTVEALESRQGQRVSAAKVYGNRIYALSINALRRFREQQFWQAGNTCRALCQN